MRLELAHASVPEVMPQSISGLTLRRANVSRKGGHWQHEDFEVFEGEREIGRIYRVTDRSDSPWFWGVSFQLTGRKSYGHAGSLDDAKAAFKAEYEVRRGNGKSGRPG